MTIRRLIVLGSGGAGKTTFARELGAILKLPVLHLDAFYWKPGWVASTDEEWRAAQERLVQQDAWIIDGNYVSTLEIRLAVADTIVLLDYPRLLCLFRAIKRRIQFAGRSRPDIAEGCPERVNREFIRWIWTYPTNGRVRVMKKLQEAGRVPVILRTPGEAKRFLDEATKGLTVRTA